jgi:MFS family permease
MDDRSRPRLSRDYWLFWWASAVSNLGDGIRLGALPLLTASITREPFPVAIATAFTMLPWLVFGLVGGAIVDRYDRRTLIVAGQIVRGLGVAALAVAVQTDRVELWSIYTVAFIIGAGEVIVDTSAQAAIPLLAPSEPGGLELANSRMASAELVTNEVVGVPIGAALFAAAAVLPFAIDAASYLVGALLVAVVATPLQGVRPSSGSSVFNDVREGLRFLLGHDFLRSAAIAVGILNMAFTAAGSLFVLLVIDVFEAPEYAFGLLVGIGAVGGFFGSLVAGTVARRLGRGNTLVGLTAVQVVAMSLIGLAPNVVVATALSFVVAFVGVIANIAGAALRQQATPEDLLGRVVASYRMIGYGGVPVGAVLGGIVASFTGVRSVFAFTAVLSAFAFWLLVKAVRHLPADLAGRD